MLGTRWSSGGAEIAHPAVATVAASSAGAPLALGLVAEQVGQHGLAGDRPLAHQHQRLDALRQVDVAAAAEADQADPLAGGAASAPSSTKATIRRATRPAICTRPISRPLAVRILNDWRSFSSDALSNEALRNLPAW